MKKQTVFLFLLLMNLSLTVHGQSTITKGELITATDRATIFLKQAQTESGAINDSTNTLFSIWETILVADALLASDNISASDTTVQRAVKWLQSSENAQQLICHNAECAQSYCIETSSLYVQLLANMSSSDEQQSRLTTINDLQEKNGSWEVGNPDVYFKTGFPSVTGFVLNLFDELHFKSSGIDSAYRFLIISQLENGSWGQGWEYYGCPGYALWQCLPAIKRCSYGKQTFEKGKAYILSTQLPNGSWYAPEYEGSNHVSAELQTAFMLSCLQEETDERSQIAFHKGISFLLEKQLPNGAWEGGLFPIPSDRYKKREYLITTALTYKLLIATLNDFNE
ncbi:MAG: prenyltransferase/squalene oxidase repeat-containing protein [Bacteroidota bacterium]